MEQPPTIAQKKAEQWQAHLRRVPLVLLLCGLLLGLEGLRGVAPSGVRCDRTAPGQVTCQTLLPAPWAWLPASPLPLEDMAITSRLCDNTPRGGVRFCHRLTLLGPGRSITLPEVRTPLAAAALTDQLQRFIAGEGSPQIQWSRPSPGVPWRSLGLGLLLAIAAWALWDVRWPPLAPSPLALDGSPKKPTAD
jgi:hypothetical protein